MTTKIVLVFLALVALVKAADEDDSFSIGLGVLSPSYTQKVGPEGVKVKFEQKNNGGFSYSIGDPGSGNTAYHHLGETAKASAGSPVAAPHPAQQPKIAEPATQTFTGVGYGYNSAQQQQQQQQHQQPIAYSSGHGNAAPVHAPSNPPVFPYSPNQQHGYSAHVPQAAQGGYASGAYNNVGPGYGAGQPVIGYSAGQAAYPALGHLPYGASAAPQAYSGATLVQRYPLTFHSVQAAPGSHSPAARSFLGGGFDGQGGYAQGPSALTAHGGLSPYAAQAPTHGVPFNVQIPQYNAAYGGQGQGQYNSQVREHGGHSNEDVRAYGGGH